MTDRLHEISGFSRKVRRLADASILLYVGALVVLLVAHVSGADPEVTFLGESFPASQMSATGWLMVIGTAAPVHLLLLAVLLQLRGLLQEYEFGSVLTAGSVRRMRRIGQLALALWLYTTVFPPALTALLNWLGDSRQMALDLDLMGLLLALTILVVARGVELTSEPSGSPRAGLHAAA